MIMSKAAKDSEGGGGIEWRRHVWNRSTTLLHVGSKLSRVTVIHVFVAVLHLFLTVTCLQLAEVLSDLKTHLQVDIPRSDAFVRGRG